MSETKHTPGPWTLRPVNEEIGEYEIVGPRHNDDTGESEYIGVVCGGLPESAANARLIAAATELLEGLWETHAALCLSNPEYVGSGLWRRNRAAIAKATGEYD